MNPEFSSIRVEDIQSFKDKLIEWANQFEVFCYLDSNFNKSSLTKFDFIVGVDSLGDLKIKEIESTKSKGFLFGYLSYETFQVKDDKSKPFIEFDTSYFFEPRYIIYGVEDRIYFNRSILEAMEILERILQFEIIDKPIPQTNFECITSEKNHKNTVEIIQEKIRNGDFYELNYCIEFQAKMVELHPISTFRKINQKIAAPMSALFKQSGKWILSFSPERFIAKRGSQLIAQPIKGTTRRDLQNVENDKLLKDQLEQNIKERAENAMIVDLMRHDLTQYAESGTIRVEEFCKVYSFNTVHQLISTISAKLTDSANGLKALIHALPVGSMTGAPKVEVVKTINDLENFSRGVYAGNIGYIDSNGDYDFNVIIRTLEYDEIQNKAAIHVGSAITLNSQAEMEYEECLLKAEGILSHFRK